MYKNKTLNLISYLESNIDIQNLDRVIFMHIYNISQQMFLVNMWVLACEMDLEKKDVFNKKIKSIRIKHA